jgi:3-isopropylmalate/(R)-2-methylmalate dehydratase small subunit
MSENLWLNRKEKLIMDKFNKLKGLVAPLDRANVDTDAIIPKQFLKSIKRTGFGPNLFDEWRYLDQGEPGRDNSKRPLNQDFILNKPEYQGASILLTRVNFGCGSSREHAPWALLDYGFKVIIAPSYADIFYNNCFKNGILPIRLDEDEVEHLFNEVAENTDYQLVVDLEDCRVSLPSGDSFTFEVEQSRRHSLLNGLDDIGITLEDSALIKQYENHRRQTKPWLFDVIK